LVRYQYYYLPFCRPDKLESSHENLGEVLRGDRITNTPYTVEMGVNKSCALVCDGDDLFDKIYTRKQVMRFERFIQLQYRANW
jgi:transmembrane 9 superfamily protein 2/4